MGLRGKNAALFRAVERLSGKLRWGCENSSGETAAGSAVTIDGTTYTLDNAGNRTAKTDQRTAVATSYGYDNIYQLLSATPSSGTAESYTYDPVGNRLSSQGVPLYSYNNSNELTSNSSATYGYDLNGNAITKNDSTGITTYAWDFENRMTSVTLPASGGTVSFKYDPFGRRIYKSSSTATSVYAYDGDNLIEETNASGAVVARYSQGLNIDEPLAMLRSSATSFYNADGLGSITSLANAAGALAQTYTFDSFGKQTASTGSLTNPFQYTGRESDSETGLYYYRARYYDPSTGRFLSEDPLGNSGDGPNFYDYALNEPVGLFDPSGANAQPRVWPKLGPILVDPIVNEGIPWGKILGRTLGIIGVVISTLNPEPLNPNDNVPRCPDPDCTRIQNEIRAAAGELAERVEDLVNDHWDLYNKAYSIPVKGLPGTYFGHIVQAEGVQNRLNNLIDQAYQKRCPIPENAWRLATRRLPSRPRGK
jgi:RHS repeat-associated protein